MTAWQKWHEDYRNPTSDLSQRLAVVQAAIRGWANRAQSGPLTLLSLCAGQGHDVVGALATHPRRSDVSGLLVEFDDGNVAAARRALETAGLLGIRVVTGDAADLRSYVGTAPADLVLMCGVFGNISDEDVHHSISALPMLVKAGGSVVWTRHRRERDLTPAIRAWLSESGFREESFVSPGPDRFAVGTHRFEGEPQPLLAAKGPLFVFQR